VVTLVGGAGHGCNLDHNWFGFSFVKADEASGGPAVQMAAPLYGNGTWSASFLVPAYLGSDHAGRPGLPAEPGRYEFKAPDCTGGKVGVVPFRVTAAAPEVASAYVAIATTTDGGGYWLAQADGVVTAYGDARSYGSRAPGASARSAIVGMARVSDGHGYWLLSRNGHVYHFGDAVGYGSLSPAVASQAPAVGIAESPDGKGYWILTADGHVYHFGDAQALGQPGPSMAPYAAIMTRNGGGYIVTASSNAATYLYPGGSIAGGGAGTALSASLVGGAASPSGNGAWEAGIDGGVITIGDTINSFYGAVTATIDASTDPVVAISARPDGKGYWLLDRSGHVYALGSAQIYSKA